MHTITLIVPVRTAKQQDAARILRKALLTEAGGFSVYGGHGIWHDGDGAPISEEHDRFEVFATDAARIRAIHYWYGRKAGEHTLARIVDGRPELVPVGPPPAPGPRALEVKHT